MDLKEVINPASTASQQTNDAAVAYMRHLIALASGCAAGALRLESLYGFGFYFAICLATTMLLFIMAGRPSRYFLKPWKALIWDGVLAALPGYVLGWSLVYSLVET